jgi:hypothetical protein
MKIKEIMKNVMVMVALLAAISLCSCEDEFKKPNEPESKEPLNHFVPADVAAKKTVGFLLELQKAIGADAVPSVEIDVVRAYGQSDSWTHLPAEVANDDSVAFYVVNLKGNGFVMASADDRLDSVFAYIPEGRYEDAVSGLWGYMQFVNLLSHRTFDGGDEPMHSGSGLVNNKTFIPQMMHTRWGRGEPYNVETVNKECTPMGVALAQIAAFYRKPDVVPYKLSNEKQMMVELHWDAILQSNTDSGGQLSTNDFVAKEVSMLIRYIEGGEHWDTFAPVTTAISNMSNLGFHVTGHLQGSLLYSYVTLQSCLSSGRLCYVRGCFPKGSDLSLGIDTPSVWVVDGCAGDLMHCNWGRDGLMNGWFLYRVFAEPEGLDFDYRLQFSSIDG